MSNTTRRRSARLSAVKNELAHAQSASSAALSKTGLLKPKLTRPVVAHETKTSASILAIDDPFGSSDLSELSESEAEEVVPKKPAKRVKRSHPSPAKRSSTSLAFFKNERLKRDQMKGLPFTSFPLDIVFEVRCNSDSG